MTTRESTATHNGKKVKRLIDAVVKKVDDNADKLATALYERALEGNVQSAKLLVDLAHEDKHVEEAVQKKPLRTLAMRAATANR